jgi:hypothetical protein
VSSGSLRCQSLVVCQHLAIKLLMQNRVGPRQSREAEQAQAEQGPGSRPGLGRALVGLEVS